MEEGKNLPKEVKLHIQKRNPPASLLWEKVEKVFPGRGEVVLRKPKFSIKGSDK